MLTGVACHRRARRRCDHRRRRQAGQGRRHLAHSLDRRRRDRDPLCAQGPGENHRRRFHEPVPRRSTQAEEKRRLYAHALGGRRAFDQSIADHRVEGAPAPQRSCRCSRPRPYRMSKCPTTARQRGSSAKIRFVASVVGAGAAGDALARSVEQDFARLAQQRSKIAKPIRALFVLTVQNGRAMVGGAGTSADAVLRLAGAENAAAASQDISRSPTRPR